MTEAGYAPTTYEIADQLSNQLGQIKEQYPGLAGEHYMHIDRQFREERLEEFSTYRIKHIYKELRTRDHSQYAEHMPEEEMRGMYLLWLQMWATTRYEPDDMNRMQITIGEGRKDFLIPQRWIDEQNVLQDIQASREDQFAKSGLPPQYLAILSHHPSIQVGEELLAYHNVGEYEISNVLSTIYSLHGPEKYNGVINRVRAQRAPDLQFMQNLENADYRLSQDVALIDSEANKARLNFVQRTKSGQNNQLPMNPEAYKGQPHFGELTNLLEPYEENAAKFNVLLRDVFSLSPYIPRPGDTSQQKFNKTLKLFGQAFLLMTIADPFDTYNDLMSGQPGTALLRMATPIALHVISSLDEYKQKYHNPQVQQQHQALGNWEYKMKIPY